MHILTAIHHWGASDPTRIAHHSGDRRLSYAQLSRDTESLAATLRRSLPDDQSPIAVIGHKQPEMLVGFLASVAAGHPYIPIDASLPAARVSAILETARTALTLTPEKVQALLAEKDAPAVSAPERQIQAEDPWYIIFTSGSTGAPKGVTITAGCLQSFLAWMLAEQKITPQAEVFLNQAPFSFDLSVMDLYLSLVTGGTLFSLSKDEIEDPPRLFPALAGSGITVWVSTPSFARLCLAEPTFSSASLPGLRKFLFCGETLPPEVAAGLLDRFPQAEVWNTYGPTEATCATTSVRIDRSLLGRYEALPVGFPKPDSRVLVQTADGHPAAEGERGEVIIAGPNVSPGYLARPDLTAQSFFHLDGQRAYHTGDWGHYQDGLLFFDGRIDNQIKLHGYRIEPGDIEANLRSILEIQDAVVLPHLNQGLPDYLVAFVILKAPPAQSEFETTRALKRQLGALLPAYMLPRKFVYCQQFPMTANGKTDRRQLSEMLK